MSATGMTGGPLDRRNLSVELGLGGQCTARSKRSGERCRLPSMLGSNVCRSHGGAAPATRAKAKRRLEQASDVLVQRLLQFALDGTVADNVALQAIRDALDRAGMGAKHALELSTPPADPVDDILDAATFDVAKLTKAQHDALAGRAPVAALPPADPGIVDVEVVDEAPPRTPSSTAGQPAAADRNDVPPRRPAWAEDPPEPPKRGLMTLEEANAALREDEQRVRAARATPIGADAPRPTRVVRARRRRR